MMASFITFWLCGGILANLLSMDIYLRPAARISAMIIWPWLFYYERTPTMKRWKAWATKR